MKEGLDSLRFCGDDCAMTRRKRKEKGEGRKEKGEGRNFSFILNPLSFSWHTLSVEAVGERLASDLTHGLTSAEAAQRLTAFGRNRLAEVGPAPLLRIDIARFSTIMAQLTKLEEIR